MKKLLLSGVLALGMLTSQCQVLLNEIQTNGADIVEIKNHSAMMVDVSTYRLCSWPTYSMIGSLTVMSGSTMLMPGDILVVSGHDMDDADDELGLYLNNSWTNPASIVDYVEWGSTGHTRSSVAQSAGIWANGDFTLAAPMGTTLAWDGGGNASTNWQVGAAPSFGQENPTAGDDCDGGSVSTPTGATSVATCTQDGTPDVVIFDHESPSGADYAYIITSDANMILGLPGDSNDFDGAPQGTCRVWGVSYTGAILAVEGDDLLDIDISDSCFSLSENFIEIARTEVSAGSVASDGDATTVLTCTEDGDADIVNFFNDSESTADYSYIVTDPSGNVLGLPPGDSNDFDGAPAGTCYVYGASHVGDIIITEGENIFTDDVFANCGELSSNFIEVIRTAADGGTVMTPDGDTSVETCTMDGTPDVVMFDHETSSEETYAYIITSDANVILGLPGDSNDFDGAPQGVCRVWGVSYSGALLALEGDDLMTISISDGCYSLSENYIEIVRHEINAGAVSTEDDATMVNTCTQDGTPDVVNFFNDSESSSNYSYIVTDPSGNVLGLPPGDSNDFDGAPEGVCYVYGASYAGNIIIQEGGNIFSDDVFDSCGAISTNWIEITRTAVDGGTVATDAGETVVFTCTQDGVADLIGFEHNTDSNAAYAYIITSDQNEILGLPIDGNDFDDAPPGTCRVWGVSYSGDFLAIVGDDLMDIDISTACFGLSENYIEVNRDIADAGLVSTLSGDTAVSICTMDAIADVIMFMNTSEAVLQYSYIITDDANNVLGLPPGNENDFNVAPAGTCRVWGLSHQGDVVIQEGENIDTDVISDGCYDLSEEFIAIYRHDVTGGEVSIVGGGTTIDVVLDDDADVVEFETTSDSEEFYAYVITDDSNTIITVLDGNSNDFNLADPGTCYAYGISWSGELDWTAGDDLSALGSDECFELSENFVTIVRELADNILTPEVVSFDLYPNPTSGLVQIQTNEVVLGVAVFDFSGKLALESANKTLDISALPVGIYTVRVRTSNGLATARVAKK